MHAPLRYQHRWIPGPAGANETILALHGTGGNEDDLVPLVRDLAPQANILSPRGNVLENGMPRFFARHGEGRLDIDDLRKRAVDLVAFVDEAAREYGFDRARVTALGYSNGANVALGMLFERPGSLARAALLRAVFAYEPDPLPDLSSKRILLLAGERDPYSRAPVTDRLAVALTSAGAMVDRHYARAGHELAQEDLEAARRWLNKE